MSKSRIKIGIYSVALMCMGAISVSSSLSVIAEHFSEYSQTMIQNLVSIPCLVIIVTTLLAGKILERVSAKTLAIIGAIFFLVGGCAPLILQSSFTTILIFRGTYGLGIGIGQVVASALIAQHFDGQERQKVQGTMTAMQMVGCLVMSFASGWLGNISWSMPFYVHLIGVLSLLGALFCLPLTAPKADMTEETEAPIEKASLNKSSWGWAITMFFTFLFGQIYSVYLSFLVAEKNIGTAAQAGTSLAFFCVGGILLGFLYGRLVVKTKMQTLSTAFFGCAVAYVLIAVANGMILVHLGSFLFGVAISIHMSCIMVNTGMSVAPAAAGLAIAVTMCAQNVAQFVSPYIFNFISSMVGTPTPVQFTYWIAVAGEVACGVVAVIWGIRKSQQQPT